MTSDILRNRNPNAPLGPFNGRVGAIVIINAEPFLITTNTDYIPALPALPSFNQPHEVYLREDMRYGTDDPTQWPQQYSETYCHLAAIPKREARADCDVMWWNPVRADMVVSASTSRLGRLPRHQLSELSKHVDKMIERVEKFANAGHSSPLLTPLVRYMTMALERLQTLPTTWEHALLDLRIVQRTYLKLCALLVWTAVYKRRKDEGQIKGFRSIDPKPVPQCMGAFVIQPQHAQDLFYAGLPFWHIRPLFGFVSNNILAMAGQRVVHSGTNLDAKIKAMGDAAYRTPWYRDPFEDDTTPSPPPPSSQPEAGPSTAPPSIVSAPAPAPSTRYHPYNREEGKSQGKHPQRGLPRGSGHGGRDQKGPDRPHGATAGHNAGRDKFEMFRADEMPDSIPAWVSALRRVDKRATKSYRGVDQHYLLPEPALLVSQKDERRRQQCIHNWVLLKDFFIHRITGPNDGTPLCLMSQEWREVLVDGRLDGEAKNARAKNRTRTVATVLGPAGSMTACWRREGEINFRFELRSLDRRASKKECASAVNRCFAGGTLVGMSLSQSQKGLASLHLDKRHPYILRLAILMLDWVTDCRRPSAIQRDVAEEQIWTKAEMEDLEYAVAAYYTQSFYEYFGRAAVLPMRLAHELDLQTSTTNRACNILYPAK
ncbi:hypothetical protein B0H19DRAFT_1260296 [Mycena capillaripes]|nr:hypothetical protein B0H19DRAFT_1260296 [Mycena capillaripes]